MATKNKTTSAKKATPKEESNEVLPLEVGYDPINRKVELWEVEGAWFVRVDNQVLDSPTEKEARELFEFRKHDANRNL